jgi:hypothetical protein
VETTEDKIGMTQQVLTYVLPMLSSYPKNIKTGNKQQDSGALILGSGDYMIKFCFKINKSTMEKIALIAGCTVRSFFVLRFFSEVANRDQDLTVLCFI